MSGNGLSSAPPAAPQHQSNGSDHKVLAIALPVAIGLMIGMIAKGEQTPLRMGNAHKDDALSSGSLHTCAHDNCQPHHFRAVICAWMWITRRRANRRKEAAGKAIVAAAAAAGGDQKVNNKLPMSVWGISFDEIKYVLLYCLWNVLVFIDDKDHPRCKKQTAHLTDASWHLPSRMHSSCRTTQGSKM
jgi:hypothetical protein